MGAPRLTLLLNPTGHSRNKWRHFGNAAESHLFDSPKEQRNLLPQLNLSFNSASPTLTRAGLVGHEGESPTRSTAQTQRDIARDFESAAETSLVGPRS